MSTAKSYGPSSEEGGTAVMDQIQNIEQVLPPTMVKALDTDGTYQVRLTTGETIDFQGVQIRSPRFVTLENPRFSGLEGKTLDYPLDVHLGQIAWACQTGD